MPAMTLHRILADRALDRLPASWVGIPRWDRRTRSAFYCGAIGPDLGYLPGGDRFLSDLSHTHRTTDLLRALLRGARSRIQTAFALGWLTHILADERVHPLINYGVGEARTGDRSVFIPGAMDPVTHLRVEMGLDAHFARRERTARGRLVRSVVLGFEDARWIASAYRTVYDLPVDPARVLLCLRGSCRMASGCSIASWGFAAYHRTPAPAGTRRVWRSLKWGLTRAFLKPLRPTDWLAREVAAVVDGFGDAFEVEFETLGVRPNFNLDTGRLESDEHDHPTALRTCQALRRIHSAPIGESLETLLLEPATAHAVAVLQPRAT